MLGRLGPSSPLLEQLVVLGTGVSHVFGWVVVDYLGGFGKRQVLITPLVFMRSVFPLVLLSQCRIICHSNTMVMYGYGVLTRANWHMREVWGVFRDP